MPPQGTYDALVLDGDHRAGIAAVRALGRGGLAVAVASGFPTSRHARARVRLPDPADGADEFTRSLRRWLQTHRTDAVLTSSDAGVEALRRARGALERLCAPALAPEAALAVATSKRRTLELAATLGIPVPREVPVSTPPDVLGAARELGFPCVLKPERSWHDDGAGRGERVAASLLVDEQSAWREGRRLVGPGAPALVQEFVTGRNEWIMLFRSGQRIAARFAARVLRTWPPLGGNDVMRESIPLPADTLAFSERLLAAMGYEGFAQVEFRRRPDGDPVLMEVNPRLTQSLELAWLAGIDFARMQVDWARGRDPGSRDGYRTGVRLSWLAGELKLLAGAALGSPPPRPRPRPVARAFLRDYLHRPPHLDGLALGDPGPTLRAIALTAADARRVARARHAR
jgi:predicted ATP-grasp superfamily ATP-dependent carboligase